MSSGDILNNGHCFDNEATYIGRENRATSGITTFNYNSKISTM
jgi:hypothetical protein